MRGPPLWLLSELEQCEKVSSPALVPLVFLDAENGA